MIEQELVFQEHFSEVAGHYNEVRTTDVDQILWIKDKIRSLHPSKGVEMGAGGGRYSRLLLQEIEGLDLTCVDLSQNMIAETQRVLAARGKNSFRCVCADAVKLPFEDSSFDWAFTFNAVHHFDFLEFLRETARVLRPGGQAFIYTRLQEQNAENIWGRFFPMFAAREDRLYDMEYLEHAFQQSPNLDLKEVERFRFLRESSADRLVEQARAKHYSTFRLYDDDEFESSLAEFRQNLVRQYGEGSPVTWTDENVMLVAQNAGESVNRRAAHAVALAKES